MPGCAMEGTRLAKLVRMAIPLCKEAEAACPRRGPGAPPTFADWQIAVMILVAILARRKSKSAQYRYLWERRRWLIDQLGMRPFPGRSTYFERYRRAYELFRAAVVAQARRAEREGLIMTEIVAVDKSLVPARGAVRHQRKRHKYRRIRGTDDEADWGYSDHHGWVYGYSFEVAVSVTHGSVVFPLTASVGTAGAAEAKTFLETVPRLPPATRYVTTDRGYDTNANGQAVEFDDADRPTGRRLVCPLIGRAGKPSVGNVIHRGRREQLRLRRKSRRRFFRSPRGRAIYKRRRIVEPFMEWLKAKFELNVRAWHRGLANNATQITAAIFAYQLLLRFHAKNQGQNGTVQWILDTL